MVKQLTNNPKFKSLNPGTISTGDRAQQEERCIWMFKKSDYLKFQIASVSTMVKQSTYNPKF